MCLAAIASFTLVACATVPPGKLADWREVGFRDGDNAPFFVDFGAIESGGAGVTFRSKVKMKASGGSGEVDIQEYWAVKCDQRVFSLYRSELARGGKVVSLRESRDAWTSELAPLQTNTMLSIAVDRVCAHIDRFKNYAAKAAVLEEPKAPAAPNTNTNILSGASILSVELRPPLAAIERKEPEVTQKANASASKKSATKPTSTAVVKTYYEQEAQSYVDASRQLEGRPPQLRSIVDIYWQRRMDIADRIDKGQLSRETGLALVANYEKQALGDIAHHEQDERRRVAEKEDQQAERVRAEARARATQEQVADTARAIQLQQDAQAQAARAADRQKVFDAGLKLLFPPPPPRPLVCNSWVNGRMIQTTCQ